MDELFTTEIAKCANKINIVHFDFTQTLTIASVKSQLGEPILKAYQNYENLCILFGVQDPETLLYLL